MQLLVQVITHPLFSAIVVPLVVGMTSAFMSVRLALRKFRTEKWWGGVKCFL
ncbi:MAG: hypothetical protein JXL80_15440 [Planctomycetes bacterium]|nr:hypothetical protein [Planctomycetota bacterium]